MNLEELTQYIQNELSTRLGLTDEQRYTTIHGIGVVECLTRIHHNLSLMCAHEDLLYRQEVHRLLLMELKYLQKHLKI